MSEFVNEVKKYCMDNSLLSPGTKVIVGVSGGADSVCLLRILLELKEVLALDVRCVHIEHGIRGEESRRDMDFVKCLCQELNVPLKIYEFDIPKRAAQTGMTVEEAGRYARYEAFNTELEACGADVIAVAHHLNDQAETVLFNMSRGSGLKGVSGMAPVNGRIIRPLLAVTREQIEEYLSKLGQEYCTDSTNKDVVYSRNGIRQLVLPELERIVTGASEHIARAADEIREADEYIRGEALKARAESVEEKAEVEGSNEEINGAEDKGSDKEVNGAEDKGSDKEVNGAEDKGSDKEVSRTEDKGSDKEVSRTEDKHTNRIGVNKEKEYVIEIEKLAAKPPIIQRYVVRSVLADIYTSHKDLESLHVNSVLGLMEKQSGRSVILPKGVKAVREYGRIIIGYDRKTDEGTAGSLTGNTGTGWEESLREDIELIPGSDTVIPGIGTFSACVESYDGTEPIPDELYTKWFDYDKIISGVRVRSRQEGDYLTIGADEHVKKLKNYFIDEKVPASKRDEIPLLTDGKHVIWVVGMRISSHYKVSADTKRVLRICYTGGNEF